MPSCKFLAYDPRTSPVSHQFVSEGVRLFDGTVLWLNYTQTPGSPHTAERIKSAEFTQHLLALQIVFVLGRCETITKQLFISMIHCFTPALLPLSVYFLFPRQLACPLLLSVSALLVKLVAVFINRNQQILK